MPLETCLFCSEPECICDELRQRDKDGELLDDEQEDKEAA
jgi:hypothetical protein